MAEQILLKESSKKSLRHRMDSYRTANLARRNSSKRSLMEVTANSLRRCGSTKSNLKCPRMGFCSSSINGRKRTNFSGTFEITRIKTEKSSGYELMEFESEMNGLEDGFGEDICEDFETDETENATLATEEIHDIDGH